MKKLKAISCLLIYSTLTNLVFAEDFDTVKRLNELRKERKEVLHRAKVERIERQTKPRKVVTMDDVLGSDLIVAVIPYGVELIHFPTNTTRVLKNNLTTLIYQQPDEFGYYYLNQKNEKIIFKVHRSKVHFLTNVTQMDVPPTLFEEIPPQKKVQFYDNNFYISHQIGLTFGYVDSAFASSALGEEQSIGGDYSGYEYSALTKWNFPIDIGFLTRWDNVTYNSGLYDSINQRTLNFGPMVRSKSFYMLGRRFQWMAKFTTSLQSKLSAKFLGGTNSFTLKNNSLELGLENSITNSFGEFIIGLSFKKSFIKIEKSDANVFINDLNSTEQTFLLTLAQRFDSKW